MCELSIPEDILTVGSTGLLLASGHRAPGHLYLIDPRHVRSRSSSTAPRFAHAARHARLP